MFRSATQFGLQAFKKGAVLSQRGTPAAIGVRLSSHKVETEAEIDARYLAYFNQPNIDGWQLRKALGEMHRSDMIPNGSICIAVLKACRRVNDYALTTRFLEALRYKTVPNPEIYKTLVSEIEPTLKELGISSVEELGFDKPELWLQHPEDL